MSRRLADMELVLARIAAWDFSQKQDPLCEFTAFLREAMGSKDELPQIEARLIKMLEAATTIAGKDYVCRQLSLIGTRACVPALARMLNDAATFGMARYALARIPDAAAVEALRRALPKTSGKARIGIINSLGERRDTRSVGQLRALLSSSDAPEMVRIEALHGLATREGKVAVPVLARELGSPNPKVQAAAITLLKTMPGAEVTALFVEQFPKLAPLGQLRVLAALAERNDAVAARPVVAEALRSSTPELRAEAMRALGKVGDASSVPVLAEASANAEGGLQSAARASLSMLPGADVEAALVALIGSSSGNVRLELIRAAGDRGSAGAAGVLMRVARGEDRDASRESIRALRTLAGPAQAQPLLNLVIELRNAEDRRDAAVALASVIRRSGRAEIGPVLEAYQASTDVAVRVVLLDVMGQVSSADALPVVRTALKDPAAEIARAAILALSAWQIPDPIPDLFDVAKDDTNQTRQILAVRGLIKLIQTPSDRSPEETVRLLAEVMQLVKQPQEKRAILSVLPNYPVKPALALAEAASNDAAVAREAKVAADQIRDYLPR